MLDAGLAVSCTAKKVELTPTTFRWSETASIGVRLVVLWLHVSF